MLKLKTTRLLTKQARAQYLSKTARGASAFLSADSAKLRHRGTNAVHMQFFNFQDLLLDVQKNPVLLEPRATRSGTDQHRFDLAVQGFDSTSTNLLLDVTVRSPLADRVMDQAAVNRLEAANKGVHDKQEYYKAFKTDNDTFWPLAVETFGGLHHNVFKLLSASARRVGNRPPDSASFLAPSFSSWLRSHSVTPASNNSLKTTPQPSRTTSSSCWLDLLLGFRCIGLFT
eukprot:m.59790 g.59790  ORF g.59790 m.59790 type:complete len:229 (+) comp49277_c0_seq4:1190-1876(+)